MPSPSMQRLRVLVYTKSFLQVIYIFTNEKYICNFMDQLDFIKAHDLDFFLEAADINEELYRLLLIIKRQDNSDFSPERVFHSAYYLLYQATKDSHPEAIIDTEYQTFLFDYFKPSLYYPRLVFSVMRTLLELQPSLSIQQDRFLEQLAIRTYSYESYWLPFEKILANHKQKKEMVEIDFTTLTFRNCSGNSREIQDMAKDSHDRIIEELRNQISQLEEYIRIQDTDKMGGTRKVKCLLIEVMLKELGVNIASIDQTRIARFAGYLLGIPEKKAYKVIQPGISVGDYHDKEINTVNELLSDLGLMITI